MNKSLSQTLSYVFHPLLMPTLSFGLLYVFLPEAVQPLSIMVLPFLFLTTFVIPLLSISMIRWVGTIKSIKMERREDRVVPFIYVTIFYVITAYMFTFRIQANVVVYTIFVSTCLLLALLTLITNWFKISIHAAGMMGVTGYLLALSLAYPGSQIYYPALIMLVCSGWVMSARLALKAHSLKEIMAGAIVGLGLCLTSLLLVL